MNCGQSIYRYFDFHLKLKMEYTNAHFHFQLQTVTFYFDNDNYRQTGGLQILLLYIWSNKKEPSNYRPI